MGLGAYTTAILTTHHGVRDLWTIPLGGLVAGGAGFLFGFPALRLAGVYLAVATFALPIALASLAKKFEGFTGGGGGLILHLPHAELGVHTSPSRWLYYVTWSIAAVLLLAAWLFVRGRTGRALRSVHASETAAAASGVNVAAFKTLARRSAVPAGEKSSMVSSLVPIVSCVSAAPTAMTYGSVAGLVI